MDLSDGNFSVTKIQPDTTPLSWQFQLKRRVHDSKLLKSLPREVLLLFLPLQSHDCFYSYTNPLSKGLVGVSTPLVPSAGWRLNGAAQKASPTGLLVPTPTPVEVQRSGFLPSQARAGLASSPSSSPPRHTRGCLTIRGDTSRCFEGNHTPPSIPRFPRALVPPGFRSPYAGH